MALQLPGSFDAIPIPCSIVSVNVVQSLGAHIATLNVDGHHRVPTWFSERASLGRPTHGRLHGTTVSQACPLSSKPRGMRVKT
jgi:hypothetical protein